MLRDFEGFDSAVRNVIDHVSFDVDTKPQVFEITIRVLGGLLSGHIFASDKLGAYNLPWYKDELLHLAYDLGERLLPAFRTSTGIPYARVRPVIHTRGGGQKLYASLRPIYGMGCRKERLLSLVGRSMT